MSIINNNNKTHKIPAINFQIKINYIIISAKKRPSPLRKKKKEDELSEKDNLIKKQKNIKAENLSKFQIYPSKSKSKILKCLNFSLNFSLIFCKQTRTENN